MLAVVCELLVNFSHLSAVISMHDAQEGLLQTKSRITFNSQLKFNVSTYDLLEHV
jgi:hypothetical protein